MKLMVCNSQIQSQRTNTMFSFDWFIDSGASESFTDQMQIISDFTPIAPGSMIVCGIGGISLEVHGFGNVHIIAEVNKKTS